MLRGMELNVYKVKIASVSVEKRSSGIEGTGCGESNTDQKHCRSALECKYCRPCALQCTLPISDQGWAHANFNMSISDGLNR